jgi:hypothetical protein
MSTASAVIQERTAPRVVQVDETHLEPLAEIIRQAWSPDATTEAVRRARAAAAEHNPHGAGTPVPTFLFLSGERPLGHLTTVPTTLWVGGVEHRAHWFKGFWVVPEQRNGPVGFTLLREAMRQLQTTLSMVVQPAPRRLFASLGLQDFGPIPNFVRLLRPGNVLRRLSRQPLGPRWARPAMRTAGLPGISHLIGGAAQLALQGWTLSQPEGIGVRVVAPERLDPAQVDALWRRSRGSLRAAPVRDFTHVYARCLNRPDSYHPVVLEEGGEVLALALIRRPRADSHPRLQGIRVATLSELLCPPDRREHALRLLAGVETAAADMGADALLCSASHRTLPWVLARRGYLRLPGNVHFMAKPADFALDGLNLEDWWLTRADGEADDAL